MKTNILAIGKNEEILQTLLRLINKNDQWTGEGALTDEEAMAIFRRSKPSLVLLCNGIDEKSEQTLRTYFTQHDPSIKIIQHYGGGSGLLTNEILQALGVKRL